MRVALLLACGLGLGGCFFSLDGNLVNRPRDGGVKDGRRDGVREATPTERRLNDLAPSDLAPVADLAADVTIGLDK